MDEIDRNILIAVQKDGAAGLAELAKVAGLSVSATAERIKRLEERNTIRGWRADLDPEAIGCPLLGFVFVRTSSDGRAAFEGLMRGLEPVLECHSITGSWTFLLKIRAESLQALETFISDVLARFDGVARAKLLIATSSAKETSILPISEADEE
ncbi:Lrp/AsnC family transcriptional regulator [Roseomonas elaeocarpi]|uniref:Lrp/AsnC family transcriptional regulator n=1 Tax=Roseomonas elaeocarpi TaxID=907779 RepID=A0ABV6JQL1_9PROT